LGAANELAEELLGQLRLRNLQGEYAQHRHRVRAKDESLDNRVRELWHGVKLDQDKPVVAPPGAFSIFCPVRRLEA